MAFYVAMYAVLITFLTHAAEWSSACTYTVPMASAMENIYRHVLVNWFYSQVDAKHTVYYPCIYSKHKF